MEPDRALRQGEAIGGDHAITGTLPTLDDVIAYKEGTADFDHGYYRFVPPPQLRLLQKELERRFGCRHCKLTESLQTSLLELILCLHAPGAPCRIVIVTGEGAAAPFSDASFLPACDREGVSVLVFDRDRGGELLPVLGRDDILVVAGVSAETAHAAEARQSQSTTVIAVVTSTAGELPAPPDIPGARFFVLGLGGADRSAQGGAVLGNADRVMDRLAEQMKRRGPVLSSRAVEHLEGHARAETGDSACRVAEALCGLEGGGRAFLYSSGMSAITRVLDLVRSPGRSQVIAVGHLYNDTFQTLRSGRNLFLGVDDLDELDSRVSDQTAAILTETITNPLSDVPDLDVLSRVARARGVPLIVDNTLATPANCHPFDFGADYVIHSTTKYLNGQNDHAGGTVIVRDPALAKLLADAQTQLNDEMSLLEAAVLERNLDSFPHRIERFNRNAVKIAAFLAGHRGVARIFFNGHPSHRTYAVAQRNLRGPGSVISFILARNTWKGLRAFYDSRLHGIVKAPSLGSDVTLLCPYTLLTHYDDTDEELAEIGLPRFLVRIAVGCERDISPVLGSLDEALSNHVRAE